MHIPQMPCLSTLSPQVIVYAQPRAEVVDEGIPRLVLILFRQRAHQIMHFSHIPSLRSRHRVTDLSPTFWVRKPGFANEFHYLVFDFDGGDRTVEEGLDKCHGSALGLLDDVAPVGFFALGSRDKYYVMYKSVIYSISGL